MKVSPKYLEIYSKLPKNVQVSSKNVSVPIAASFMSAAAASSIIAASNIKRNDITVENIEKRLITSGFSKDENGNLRKTFSDNEKEQLKEKFGFVHKNYIKLLETPITKEDLNNFKKFIHLGGEEGKKLYSSNLSNLFLVYRIMDNSCMIPKFEQHCQENKSNYDFIKNIVKGNLVNSLETVSQYKSDCASDINNTLRNLNVSKSPSVKKTIDNLSSFLSTQTVPEDIKLYRGEGYEVLNMVKVNDTKYIDLGQMMKEAAIYEDDALINEVRELILDNDIEAVQPGFTSTSLSKKRTEIFSNNRLVWEFTPEPNTKGSYVDAINLINFYASEDEVLLQKNSKIKIKDAEYDKEKMVWNIKATISN
jgi:hypothetical protein